MKRSVTYVPVLTGKTGEFAALRALADDVVQALWPVLDLPPVGTGKSVEDVIDKLVGGIGGAALGGRAAVDLLGVHQGRDQFDFLLERARWNGAALRLAVRTDAPDVYVQDAAAALPESAGLCLRARVTEAGDRAMLAARVDGLLHDLSATAANTHLIFDCGHVGTWRRGPHLVVAEHLDAWTDLRDFALVSMAATAVPEKIGREDPPMRVQRREWTSWRQLADRGIGFGDYGITGPRSTRPPQGLPDPHLRYTTDSALLIWRGRADFRVSGDDDEVAVGFGELCRSLVHDEDDFAGPDFSAGDEVFAQIAAGGRHTDGSASGWVEWATSHHLTHVVRQLQAG